MLFDIGFAPIITLLLAAVALAILADFLLELVSVRLTLSSGRFQYWLFDRFGRHYLCDTLISTVFQLISFRKRAFFMQLASFKNVGSFSRRQSFFILIGAFVGMGLSAVYLLFINQIFGAALVAVGFVLTFFKKDQFKDVGLSLLNFGLLILSIYFFNQFLMSSPLTIHQYEFQQPFIFLIIFFTSVFFRTPIAFLLIISMIHFMIGLNALWWPIAFFAHSLFFLSRYYFHFIQRHTRLYPLLASTLFLQVLLFATTLLLAVLFKDSINQFMIAKKFVSAFEVVVVAYIIYFAIGMLLLLPVLYLFSYLPLFNEGEKKNGQNQKILSLPQRGNLFSLHFSMFLLRQEFLKFTTLVHTIFKLSREADAEEETVNERLTRYQRILIRVGEEIKELCFTVGKQRSYRWHVQEILSFYKYVNQLELLVDDLSQIHLLLQENNLDEDWEKECRYWLSIQLRIFESFFNYVAGVGRDEEEKVKSYTDKSYEVLRRLFSEEVKSKKIKNLSKNFYRLAESNANLAL